MPPNKTVCEQTSWLLIVHEQTKCLTWSLKVIVSWVKWRKSSPRQAYLYFTVWQEPKFIKHWKICYLAAAFFLMTYFCGQLRRLSVLWQQILLLLGSWRLFWLLVWRRLCWDQARNAQKWRFLLAWEEMMRSQWCWWRYQPRAVGLRLSCVGINLNECLLIF